MSDEVHVHRKRYRRRRRSTSEQYDDSLAEASDQLGAAKRAGRGLYCKNCNHRYSWAKLVCQYEKRGTDLIRLWVCECGNVLREDNLEG